MAHFDKHSTSIKALIDVSEAMLNAMEEHGIDPETVANRNEFTVMMVADRNANLRAIVPVLVDCKRGITLRAQTLQDQVVIDACRVIHEADPVSGCYNIQLIKTMDGLVKPFEINPRISTTTCLGLAAGVDFIQIYLEASDPRHELAKFTNFLKLKRSWYNEIYQTIPFE